MKDILIILRRNFLSPIVIAIFVLATTLLVLGESRDAFFISVVIFVNTLFAVAQEIRAERALKKLELMSAPHARRRQDDGTFADVMYDQLTQGDVVQLMTGDEVPADAEIIETQGLEVNESILTGESASILKDKGKTVLAASAIVAGSGLAKVLAVGANSKAGKMTASLKRYTPQMTPLQQAINRAITLLTYGALLLAALIFVVYVGAHQDAVSIFKTITAGAVTVVPEGLVLASSLLLALGSLRLAQAKVLPQKLAAIEAMAVLSVLCVDKTGTLTSDEMKFEDFIEFDGYNKKQHNALIGAVARETSGGNATGAAIAVAFPTVQPYDVVDVMAFSSARKMSGVRIKYGRETATIFIGAPEFLAAKAKLSSTQQKAVDTATSQGKRTLLVVYSDDHKTPLKDVKNGMPIGLIVLSNPLRVGVKKTVAYLQRSGVNLRVISGDNPQTVQYIAAMSGIKNSDSIITGAELAKLRGSAWEKAVLGTTIFARVLPEQKERLIETFQSHGLFTGMVGDGVNDALALKKANLGVAMYAGAAASRRVSDIILLNNSFNSLPLGMKLGNRIMQAIELIAVLFFHKIIFGVVLLLSSLALGMIYPFEPRHVTFMNIFLVTMPTLMWTLFPPRPQHRVNPHHFWRDTLQAVAPIAVLSGVAVMFTYWSVMKWYPSNQLDGVTMVVIVATFFGIYLVLLASRMIAVIYDRSAKTAQALYIASAASVGVMSFGIAPLRDFFDFTQPNWGYLFPALAVIVIVAILQYKLAVRAGSKLRQAHFV